MDPFGTRVGVRPGFPVRVRPHRERTPDHGSSWAFPRIEALVNPVFASHVDMKTEKFGKLRVETKWCFSFASDLSLRETMNRAVDSGQGSSGTQSMISNRQCGDAGGASTASSYAGRQDSNTPCISSALKKPCSRQYIR
jgi:hypothetical protein